jgi:hypothetical protein
MKGYIYLTKELNSDGFELKHNGLTKIGIGKSVDPMRRFYEHHNKGSKSTIGMEWLNEFEVDNMDQVESEIHRILKSLNFSVVNRVSSSSINKIESRTEVFSGKHIDTNEEISEKLIIHIIESIVSGAEFIKITRKEFMPRFLQELVIRNFLDIIENEQGIDVNIVSELCARFGKTLTYLELFRRLEKDVMILPSYMHSVFTSFKNEIVGKYDDEKIGKWSNFVDFKIIDTREDENWIKKYNDNLGKSKLVVFVSIQTPSESFSKFDIIKNTASNRKFTLIDEGDLGAHTENSQKVIDYVSMGGLKIVTSGTGIERAAKSLIDKKISDIVSVSYTEMLLSKKGNSKYFTDEYLNELNPKFKNSKEFLKNINKEEAKKSHNDIPDINFFKMVLPEKHRNLIHSELHEDDLTGWSKILSDVKKNNNIIKPIIKGLFGKTGVKDSYLDTLEIDKAILREAKVVQFFVGTPTKKELSNLTELFKSCLPNYIIRTLSGDSGATNATSESIVKNDIEICKEEEKDGVIILSMDMGSRSFSISETDAVVLMYDNGSVSSLIQKISRALTSGNDFYGNKKDNGNVISLSLDPNRVDSVDVYVVEESQKNKTKSESFLTSVRRIKKSINIFLIENGDRIELLEKDEYYSELIEKFNFEKLKNSQIDILPLISDADLRNDFLDIKSSDLVKKEEKVKQLKGKGRKFLDHKEKDSKKDSDIEKVDIEILRKAILTITNSLLSIVAIDNSIFDKSKSFRSILNSIEKDDYKTSEFKDLYGISPNIVIRLIDKEVINERIIDICISKF